MSLYPLKFHPIFKERVWGGRKLEELYHKRLPPAVPIGESWEISDRLGDVSVIAQGPFAGKDLHWLIENHSSELLGEGVGAGKRFPLLVKILDARKTLSLQVHPPADKADALGGEPKTEMWYVAHADPGAELFVGLKRGTTRKEFEQKIAAGSVAECFHRLPVKAGDAMFLPSGRVHALGGGLVIFEIQQNSDTTYRVFDWNRVGLDGNPRPLHIKESLECIDFEDFEPALVSPKTLPGGPLRIRALVQDALFSVDLVDGPKGERMGLECGKAKIVAILKGAIRVEDGAARLRLSGGDFCLIPAALDRASVHVENSSSFLLVTVEG